VVGYFGKQQMKKIAAAWQQAADLVGGQFVPQGGSWFSRTPMQVVAEVEGVEVRVDHYTVSHGKSSTTYTRITAAASAPQGLTLKVYVEGFFSTIGKALGTQDVNVGDREFDDAFMVKASDEDMARLWIGPEIRRAALATREYSVGLAAGTVTSIRIGLETDGEKLARAMREVALFAGRGRKLLDKWSGLARELNGNISAQSLTWPGDSRAAIQLEHHGALITVALAAGAVAGDPPRLGTRVSASRTAPAAERFTIQRRTRPDKNDADPFGDPAFAKAFVLQAADPGRALRRLTDELRRSILALDPEEIRAGDADIALVLDGAELKRQRLDAAIAIVSALAAPISDGPYR